MTSISCHLILFEDLSDRTKASAYTAIPATALLIATILAPHIFGTYLLLTQGAVLANYAFALLSIIYDNKTALREDQIYIAKAGPLQARCNPIRTRFTDPECRFDFHFTIIGEPTLEELNKWGFELLKEIQKTAHKMGAERATLRTEAASKEMLWFLLSMNMWPSLDNTYNDLVSLLEWQGPIIQEGKVPLKLFDGHFSGHRLNKPKVQWLLAFYFHAPEPQPVKEESLELDFIPDPHFRILRAHIDTPARDRYNAILFPSEEAGQEDGQL